MSADMNHSARHEAAQQIEQVRRTAAQLRDHQSIPPSAIERDLADGCGLLVALEAWMLRSTRDPPDAAVATPVDLSQTAYAIALLREALTELRALSSRDGMSRGGYGVVLPAIDRAFESGSGQGAAAEGARVGS